MPTTRYKPTASYDPGCFSDLIGGSAAYTDIDDDPVSPNTSDGVKRAGAPTQTDSLNLYVEPPIGSLDSPVAINARAFGHCTGDPNHVVITAASLVDENGAIAAEFTGSSHGFGTGDSRHELPLIYTPGTYDWSTARLVIDVEWNNYSDLFMYAIDYTLNDDPPPDPENQAAAFFLLLTNP